MMSFKSALRRTASRQLIPFKNYHSLAVGINELRTLEPESYSTNQQLEKLQLTPTITKFFDKENVPDSLKTRFEMLQKMSAGYYLPNDLILKSLFPHEDTFINIKSQETGKVLCASTKSIEQMGFNLFKLEKTLFLMERFGEDIENQDLLSHVLETKLSSKFITGGSTLNKYLENSRLLKIPFITKGKTTERTEIIASKESLYTMIGFVAHRHGKAKASQFIREKIILGKGGLFDVVLNKMNYK